MFRWVMIVLTALLMGLGAPGESLSTGEPADQFYGDRSGGVQDLAGNHWWIATHFEDVPPEELKLRAERWLKERTRVEV